MGLQVIMCAWLSISLFGLIASLLLKWLQIFETVEGITVNINLKLPPSVHSDTAMLPQPLTTNEKRHNPALPILAMLLAPFENDMLSPSLSYPSNLSGDDRNEYLQVVGGGGDDG